MELAVLFLDICGFSKWPNSSFEDQKAAPSVLHMFLSEMIAVVRDHNGKYEKNTGDGIMAYFADESKDPTACVRRAAEAAVVMYTINERIITPALTDSGFQPVRFRIGLDFGCVTVGRIGVNGTNSVVAIGTTANIACHIMDLTGQDGLCLGNNAYQLLPRNWGRFCTQVNKPTGYFCGAMPYQAWNLDHHSLAHAFDSAGGIRR